MSVTLGIGTAKGAWIARRTEPGWQVEGPYLKGWTVTTFGRAPGGDHLLATGSTWYGAALHRSRDLQRWEQIVAGPAYDDASGRKLNQVWTLVASGEDLYAGVDEAGMFVSRDDGESWEPVPGLNEHRTRSAWSPGLGGLAAHGILVDPIDPARIWCGISAVGVFRTVDGGRTWDSVNRGVQAAVQDDEVPEIGYCVHSIAHDPNDTDRIWRQDHRGVYRTSNGGDSWERIQTGLPNESGFGFPIVRNHASGRLFIVPQESDEYRMPVDGKLRVFRSDDDGDTWLESGVGLPRSPDFAGVLRDAMDCDQTESGGICFGTTSGGVYYSEDGGDHWDTVPGTYPRVLSVKVLDP